jgi:hypothetical protein
MSLSLIVMLAALSIESVEYANALEMADSFSNDEVT